jgi:hypothetical protein
MIKEDAKQAVIRFIQSHAGDNYYSSEARALFQEAADFLKSKQSDAQPEKKAYELEAVRELIMEVRRHGGTRLAVLAIRADAAISQSPQPADEPTYDDLVEECKMLSERLKEADEEIADFEQESDRGWKEADRLLETIKYLVGIAERGEGKSIPGDITVEQFVLGYVKRLEAAQQEPVSPAQAQADSEDAKLYRWLRDGVMTNRAATIAMWEANSCEELDAAIRAAMQGAAK